MLRKKGFIAAAIGAAVVCTSAGRDRIGALVAAVKRRCGANGSDPFAVAPTEQEVIESGAASAAELPPEDRLEFAAQQPPTPGTVAVAVGAPNAPDLDVIAGDHDAEHGETD